MLATVVCKTRPEIKLDVRALDERPDSQPKCERRRRQLGRPRPPADVELGPSSLLGTWRGTMCSTERRWNRRLVLPPLPADQRERLSPLQDGVTVTDPGATQGRRIHRRLVERLALEGVVDFKDLRLALDQYPRYLQHRDQIRAKRLICSCGSQTSLMCKLSDGPKAT